MLAQGAVCRLYQLVGIQSIPAGDQGRGIAADALAEVFNQSHESTKCLIKDQGTGKHGFIDLSRSGLIIIGQQCHLIFHR